MREQGEPPVIAGYTIEGPLGQGSMGSVWRAKDRSGRRVAVKLPDRARRILAKDRAAMFRREALASLNVRHPSLVRGLEVGETADGVPFLAMELVEGETLSERIRAAGPLSEREAVSIGHAVAAGLEHAHTLGLLHRDVKPDNVMLLPDGSVKLVDLSLVAEQGLGEAGCGSPGYASPEMILRGDVGPPSDLYALGVTLAAAVLGHAPFQGADAKAVLRASLKTPLEVPERVGDRTFSEGFRAVVARLGKKDAAARYPSAGELRLDFEALAHGERPLGAYLGLARFRTRISTGWRLMAAAVVVVAAGSIALAVSTREPRAKPPAPSPPPRVEAPPASDPRGEAVLLYLDAHPDEFAHNRGLLAERLAAGPSTVERRRLEEASRALEERFDARAEELLKERSASARALAARGDLATMARALADWPADFAESPQAAKAKRLAEDLRSEALAPGEKLIQEAGASLSRFEGTSAGDLDAARALEARLLEFEGRAATDAAQRSRVAALRERVRAYAERLESDRRVQAGNEALANAVAKADAGDPAGSRALLERLADEPGAGTDAQRLALEVVRRGRAAQEALQARLAVLEGRAWAAIVNASIFVGLVRQAPTPRSVFAPGWIAPRGLPPQQEFSDLLAAIPDRETGAAWLLYSGMPEAAARLGEADGAAGRLLAAARYRTRKATPPVDAGWGTVVSRFPMLLRAPDGRAPELDAGGDVVLTAWQEAVKSRGRAPDGRKPAKPLPIVAAARDAFLADDGVRAWGLLLDAAAAAPRDAEVALLESRVLESLWGPVPTLGVALLALEEARRAWDLDPSLSAGSKRFAELSLKFRARYPGSMSDALDPVMRAACEEVLRLGQADATALGYLAERRLEEGRPKDAAPLIRRAAREAPDDPAVAFLWARVEDALGDPKRAREILESARNRFGLSFPARAQELLDKLSKR